MIIWSAEIKELETLYISIKGKFPDLERELEQLIETKDANVALLYSRRCLEVIITDLCKCELKRERGTEPLKGIVDKLRKEGKVPLNITTSMDHLNGLSTFGTHPKDFDPRQVKPVLNNLSTILEWYLKYKNIGIHDILLEDSRLAEERSLKVTMVKWDKLLPWSLTGIVVLIAIIYGIFWSNNFQESQPVSKYIINLPPGEVIGIDGQGSAVAFSPDGTKLCFVSKKDDINSLYLRNIDEFEAKPIPNTQNASAPFFSPDGKWIGFFANGNLKKILIQGGSSHIICKAESGISGSWGRDNLIIFEDTFKRGLMRVPSEGGTPEQITTSFVYKKGETDRAHSGPHILPSGKIVLFTISDNMGNNRIVAYSLTTGKMWNLIESGSNPKYIQTGHLVYAWKGDLLTIPLNIKKMKCRGSPVILVKGVMMKNNNHAYYSISQTGSLIYTPGTLIESPEQRIILIDRHGTSESLNIPKGTYQSPRFSPNGKEILLTRYLESPNLWKYGLERGTFQRFTERDYESYWGIWTPDGKRIIFNSNLQGSQLNLYWKLSDGTGPSKRISTSNYLQLPKSFSKDGKILIYTEGVHPNTNFDVLMIQMEGDSTPKPLLNSKYNETNPILSPDGHWLAYVSDESGREEVFVCSFPDLGNKTPISTEGGIEPLWAKPDGKELYYRDITGDSVMSVSLITEPYLVVSKPKLLFHDKSFKSGSQWGRNYDISPDGSKFLMIETGEEKITSPARQINVILNWSEELEELGKTFNKIKQ